MVAVNRHGHQIDSSDLAYMDNGDIDSFCLGGIAMDEVMLPNGYPGARTVFTPLEDDWEED